MATLITVFPVYVCTMVIILVLRKTFVCCKSENTWHGCTNHIWMTCTIIQCPMSLSQIMALVVIALGVSVSIFFQIFVRENPDSNPPRRRWYKWFMNSQFYVVSCQLEAKTSQLSQCHRETHGFSSDLTVSQWRSYFSWSSVLDRNRLT